MRQGCAALVFILLFSGAAARGQEPSLPTLTIPLLIPLSASRDSALRYARVSARRILEFGTIDEPTANHHVANGAMIGAATGVLADDRCRNRRVGGCGSRLFEKYGMFGNCAAPGCAPQTLFGESISSGAGWGCAHGAGLNFEATSNRIRPLRSGVLAWRTHGETPLKTPSERRSR
jgi:hypothetical protein